MTDYVHLSNIIQGAVIQIRERRPIHEQPKLLDELQMFLMDQGFEVGQSKQAAVDDLMQSHRDLLEGKNP